MAGEVVAVNDALTNNPGLVNSDPFAGGWMVKIKPTNPADVETLLSSADYDKKTGHA